jgi:hypothetical protein
MESAVAAEGGEQRDADVTDEIQHLGQFTLRPTRC